MTRPLLDSALIGSFLDTLSGQATAGGQDRAKQIVRRLVGDLFTAIEDLDIQPEEFWTAVNWLNETGRGSEFGLVAAGLGFEHYLDLRLDALDALAGLQGGTPRTIEGPLYVSGAPLETAEARLDDGSKDSTVLVMHGQVRDSDGLPLAGAIVDVWHADELGNYSFFDKSQSSYNLRRRIQTDAEGRYKFRSIMPAGYGCPPQGTTQALLDQLGRHGRRPAHIHFFVSAEGHRHLTTQINIPGDAYLHDDFAYATRDELIPEQIVEHAAGSGPARELNVAYVEVGFDFVLGRAVEEVQIQRPERVRASA